MLIFYIGSPTNTHSKCKKLDRQCFLLAEPLHSLCPTPRSPGVLPPPLKPAWILGFCRAPLDLPFVQLFHSTEWTALGPRRGQERPPRYAAVTDWTALRAARTPGAALYGRSSLPRPSGIGPQTQIAPERFFGAGCWPPDDGRRPSRAGVQVFRFIGKTPVTRRSNPGGARSVSRSEIGAGTKRRRARGKGGQLALELATSPRARFRSLPLAACWLSAPGRTAPAHPGA